MIPTLPDLLIQPVIRAALAEDLGRAGDVTAAACIPEGARMRARVRGAEGRACWRASTACGWRCWRWTRRPRSTCACRTATPSRRARCWPRSRPTRAPSCRRERTALNLLGRLCGVATLTRAYVEAVAGTGARIADTRKTTPGLRALEKHAVRCGGGVNHRFGLDDAILIKDNHVAVCGGVGEAVRPRARHVGHLMKIEVEVDGLDQLDQALALVADGQGPDVIMLDNFSLPICARRWRRAGGTGDAGGLRRGQSDDRARHRRDGRGRDLRRRPDPFGAGAGHRAGRCLSERAGRRGVFVFRSEGDFP